MISEETERRAVAFIRSVADDCKGCFRRDELNCRRCRARWANEIMEGIRGDDRGGARCAEEYGYGERIAAALEILARSNHPMTSIEIDLREKCPSKHMKHRILTEMVRRRLITREKVGSRYLYGLPQQKQRKE